MSSQKRWMLIVGASLTVVIALCVSLIGYSASLKRDIADLKSKKDELSRLRVEYLALSGAVAAVESKKSLARVGGIVQAVDEVFQSLGLRQKVKSIKPSAVRELPDAAEEEAEVVLEKVDMNELINIFYRLDNAPMILTVKRTVLKSSFDNPALLNVSMTISLVKQK